MKTLHYLLMLGIHHGIATGYDLSKWIEKAASHYWTATHSSIYPALGDLSKLGFLESHSVPSENGPRKTVYGLTGGGRDALLKWLADGHISASETRDVFLVKVLGLDLIPNNQAVSLIEDHKSELEARLEYFEKSLNFLKEKNANSASPQIGLELNILRGVISTKAAIEWCSEAIRRLEASNNDGTASSGSQADSEPSSIASGPDD